MYLISKKTINYLKPGTDGTIKLEAGTVFLKFVPILTDHVSNPDSVSIYVLSM